MLKLYDYFRSSASFRVRIALNLKGLDYQAIPIHLLNNGGEQYSSEYQKINSQNLVPTFQDNDKIITQSIAIMEYLNEVYPENSLLPQDAYQKALARSFALSIIADMHPINNLRVLKYLTNELNISEDKKNQWYQHWMKKGLTALETQISNSSFAGEFCFGDKPTMADICLVPQMYNARRFKCDITDYPLLTQIDEHCQKHPAFIKAWPHES